MIISHSKRFIFIKTRKTAGSSLQKALALSCSPGDILYSSPTLLPSWASVPKIIPIKRFHAGKSYIKENFPDEWRSYTKITVERNPIHKIVSLYWWQMRSGHQQQTFEEWFDTRPDRALSDFDLYGDEEGNVLVDHVILFESLQDGYRQCCDDLGLEAVPLSVEKHGGRREDDIAANYFNEDMLRRMKRIFSREIDAFGYDISV